MSLLTIHGIEGSKSKQKSHSISIEHPPTQLSSDILNKTESTSLSKIHP
jgi:hypothetical protein